MNRWLAVAAAAFVVGVVLGALLARRRREKPAPPSPKAHTLDWSHALDLVCRAHGAVGACCVSKTGESAIIAAADGVGADILDRTLATARMALSDARAGPIPLNEMVALGDGDLGFAVAFAAAPDGARVAALGSDLLRLASGYRAREARESTLGAAAWDPSVPGLDSLESVAFALCESARALSGRATAVVLRDPNTQVPGIVAVSQGADRRLIGTSVTPASAAARACRGSHPVVAKGEGDLFGNGRGDRRRVDDEGTAYPLRDTREGAGALIVFGSAASLDTAVRSQVMRLAISAGPRLASAAAVRAADQRAQTDELTGLPNRRALKRAMGSQEGPCAVLGVDLDHFKRLNDTFGHAAGDAALRHVARVFRSGLRDGDMAARTGGEEFTLWLPGANLSVAIDIAERVRLAVGAARLTWEGREVALTCSIGVAACPDSAQQPANLMALADAALYRAKQGGRNRIEAAMPQDDPRPGQLETPLTQPDVPL